MGNCVKEVVRKYVKKYKTRDPFKLAEFLGIEVQMGTPGCSGCYMFLKNHRYIFLDQNLNELDLLQVMAHELGHAILHRKQNCYFIRNKTLLLNSKTPENAVTTSAFGFSFKENNLPNTNFGFRINSRKISFTLSETE